MLHIGKNNPRLDYFMDGKLLPSVEFEKDLGLNITENPAVGYAHQENC